MEQVEEVDTTIRADELPSTRNTMRESLRAYLLQYRALVWRETLSMTRNPADVAGKPACQRIPRSLQV